MTTCLRQSSPNPDLDWRWILADRHNLFLTGLGVDARGDVYVTDNRSGPIYFGGTALVSRQGGVFLCKYESSGKYLWAKWAVLGERVPFAAVMAVDRNGNVHLAGAFEGEISVDTIVLQAIGRSTFLAKFDRDGRAIWARALSEANENPFAGGYAQPKALALDAAATGGYVLVAQNTLGSSTSLVATVQLSLSPRFVTRKLPAFYAPGTPVQVIFDVTLPEATTSYWIEDTPRDGWIVRQIGPGGSYDPARGRVTFGPISDRQPRRLSFPERLPLMASSSRFLGEIVCPCPSNSRHVSLKAISRCCFGTNRGRASHCIRRPT